MYQVQRGCPSLYEEARCGFRVGGIRKQSLVGAGEKRGYGLQNKVGWTDHLQTAVPGRGPSDACLEEEKIDDFYVMECHRQFVLCNSLLTPGLLGCHTSQSIKPVLGQIAVLLGAATLQLRGIVSKWTATAEHSGERRQNCDWMNTLPKIRGIRRMSVDPLG